MQSLRQRYLAGEFDKKPKKSKKNEQSLRELFLAGKFNKKPEPQPNLREMFLAGKFDKKPPKKLVGVAPTGHTHHGRKVFQTSRGAFFTLINGKKSYVPRKRAMNWGWMQHII